MSPETNNQFVLLPAINQLSQDGLHYKDLLTYVAIRSFNNNETDDCLPGLDTISRRSGMNKKTTMESIKRLELSGLLKVTKSTKKHVSNRYQFKKCSSFLQIPYSVFKTDDLTFNQRAMLVFIRQCFDSVNLECLCRSIKAISEFLGVTYKVLHCQFNVLIAKGYIEKSTKLYDCGDSRVIIKLTDKLNWKYQRPSYEAKFQQIPNEAQLSQLQFK